MEKYNPSDTRIHDPELAHQMALVANHYMPYLDEARQEYGQLLITEHLQQEANGETRTETRNRIIELQEQIKEYKTTIQMYQWELLVAELNRRYLTEQ